jgi:hypothetical protein
MVGVTRGSHIRQPYCVHSQFRLLSERRNLFKGHDAQVRRSKKVREVIQKHEHQIGIRRWIDGSHIQQLVGGFGQDYPRSSLPLLDLEDQSLDLDYSFPHACLEQQGRVQPRIARVAIQL